MKFDFYAFKLTGIAVVVFALQTIPGFTELFFLDAGAWQEVWRFITSIFLHGDLPHLLYNGFALVLFGSILERLIGGKKFLIVFFVSGILANLVSVNFYQASLGASGAVFGIIGALIIVRPGQMVWAFGLPMPIFIAGILWVIGDVIGLFVPSGIANIAHLSGLGFGLVLGFWFRHGVGKRKRRFIVDERAIRRWEGEWMH